MGDSSQREIFECLVSELRGDNTDWQLASLLLRKITDKETMRDLLSYLGDRTFGSESMSFVDALFCLQFCMDIGRVEREINERY